MFEPFGAIRAAIIRASRRTPSSITSGAGSE
jgi:hypothetical protein